MTESSRNQPPDEQRGDSEAALSELYDELRRLAARYMAGERSDHTLQPTALVHEAYLRLADQHKLSWGNRAQVLGLAAQMMRRTLVTYAETRNAGKRLAFRNAVPLEQALGTAEQGDVDILVLESALRKLRDLDERQERIVELRYFGGLSVEETAEVLGISPATVKRDWSMARAWLRRELAGA
jgi:RNA polymerase sigma factor (TIGR02999 family)